MGHNKNKNEIRQGNLITMNKNRSSQGYQIPMNGGYSNG